MFSFLRSRTVTAIAAMASTLFIMNCGGSDVSTDESEKIKSDIEALTSVYNSIGSLVESNFATCSNLGLTSDALVNKICQIAQAATVEMQVELLNELGVFQQALGGRIDQLTLDLINGVNGLDAQISNINSVISGLITDMNSAESAIIALQTATADLTRSRHVIVKDVGDFPGCTPGPCPNPIVLDPSTDYEINGIIDIGANGISLGDKTQIYGLNNFNDGITYTGIGSMFITSANESAIIRNLEIRAASANKVFDLTGNSTSRIYINNNYFYNCTKLGVMNGGGTVWLYANESYSATAMSGLNVSGTVSYLNFSNNIFTNTIAGSEIINMLQVTSGTLNIVRVSNNNNVSPSANMFFRAFNITTTPTIADGRVTDNTASNGYLFGTTPTQVTPNLSNWWFENNTGLANSTYFGSMYYTGTQTLQSAVLNAWAKILVTAPGYTGGYNERFAHAVGALTYNGKVMNKPFKVTTTIVLQNFNNQAKTVGARIYKNGVLIPGTEFQLLLPNNAAIPVTLNMSSVVNMSGNDYIEIYVARVAGANSNYYVNSLIVTAEEL
ncbi:MAG: hypothetical protein V1647_01250 [Pseudomonadota bacterium]